MNFVIVGAGALGSIYAAYLARHGHHVSLIARGQRAAALAKRRRLPGVTLSAAEP